MNVIFKEDDSLDHPSGESYLKEFIEVLFEPKFLVLESEYHLSEKLLLVRSLFLSVIFFLPITNSNRLLQLLLKLWIVSWSSFLILFCTCFPMFSRLLSFFLINR